MLGSLTNEGEQYILNLILRNVGTIEENWYLGLATEVLTEDSTLTDVVEPADDGYERKLLSFDSPALNTDDNYEVQSTELVEFGPWLADEGTAESSVTIKSIFITSADTGTTGLLLTYDDVTERQPLEGQSFILMAGNCKVSLD